MHINEQIRRQENSMKMLDIQNNLHGAPPIIAPGRWFIREERLMKVSEVTSCMPERETHSYWLPGLLPPHTCWIVTRIAVLEL